MNTIGPFYASLLSGILLLLGSCSSYQSGNASPATPESSPVQTSVTNDQTTDVDLCELIAAPEKYQRKSVRVKGYWCDCFENATLYPANCPVQKKIWVEGPFDKCKNAGRVDDFRSTAKDPGERTYGGWTFGVIAQGRLTGIQGHYGQMNQFDLQFDVDCLEHAELLDRSGKRPSEMTKEQQQKVEEFERLKPLSQVATQIK